MKPIRAALFNPLPKNRLGAMIETIAAARVAGD
jgi:hypothetical protein